ncbi:MAG: sugar phosphate isomerase/epimerase [Clostridia bacterium]|nr:sugar phosphate isomerase/epimerase [Clostridia bacterium]
MKMGISTASLYPLETECALELLGKSGIKYTEIFFNCVSELKPDFITLLKKIKDEYGMEICSIHPTMSLAESFMLFSAYDRRLSEGLEEFRRYGEIAAELGAKYVILHGGKPNGVLDDRQYCERFMLVNESVRICGGELLQENVAKFRAGSVDFLKMMVANLGEDVGFCLDVKQSIRGGYTPFDVINAVGSNIKHFHISDNNTKKDCLLPGKGSFDFKMLKAEADKIGYNGAFLIEVYRNAYNEYDELIDSIKYTV